MEKVEYTKLFELGDTHFWFVGRKEIIRRFIDKLTFPKENRILDAGCGTGNTTKFLKNYGIVFGIDSSMVALDYCQRQVINICQGSVMYLPFKDEQFTLVTLLDVLSQYSITDEHRVLNEFYRILKPNGYLLFIDAACNFIKSIHDKVGETRERYYEKKIKQLFTKTGFKILKISYINFFLFPLVFFVRVFRRFFDSSKINPQSDLKPVHPLINRFLTNVLKIEARLLQKVYFPIGSSIVCIAKKCVEKT